MSGMETRIKDDTDKVPKGSPVSMPFHLGYWQVGFVGDRGIKGYCGRDS